MDIEDTLQILLILAGIIALIVLTIQIIRIGNKVSNILDNARIASNGIAEFTATDNKIKENVSDLAGITVDKIIGKQVDRVKTNITQNVVGGVLSFIKKNK